MEQRLVRPKIKPFRLVVSWLVAAASLLGVPVLRAAPLPLVLFFLAGCAGALVTRGWGHEGRFSLHLYGSASALCCWALAELYNRRVKEEAA